MVGPLFNEGQGRLPHPPLRHQKARMQKLRAGRISGQGVELLHTLKSELYIYIYRYFKVCSFFTQPSTSSEHTQKQRQLYLEPDRPKFAGEAQKFVCVVHYLLHFLQARDYIWTLH